MRDNVIKMDNSEAIEDEARLWLIALNRDDRLSREEEQNFYEWVNRGAAQRQEILRLATFWDDADVLSLLAVPLERRSRNGILGLPRFLQRLRRPSAFAWATAAVAVIVVVVVAPRFERFSLDSTNAVYSTEIGEQRTVLLADGTSVFINTDSQVEVDYKLGSRTVKLLHGEAHFEVQSVTDMPFDVLAGQGIARAIGTAFSVRVDSDTVQVIVFEGRVSLATQAEQITALSEATNTRLNTQQPVFHSAGLLGRGGAAVFRRAPGITDPPIGVATKDFENLEITNLPDHELAQRLSWRDGYLVFAGDSLEHVISEVSRYVPVKIEIMDPDLRKLSIGGRFKVGELASFFEVLESSFDVRITAVNQGHVQLRQADPAI